MSAKQLFAPVPLRAMAADLSGLQLRVLICVAAHDRLSLAVGKGQGCRASNERMKQLVGCNYSRLCSTLTGLVDLGLIVREPLGRHTIYRVVYTDEDRLLFSNMSAPSIGCRTAKPEAPIGCRDLSESGGFPPETPSQYIPLNGGRDSVETGEYNSSEEARLATRIVEGVSKSAGRQWEKNRQKAGLSGKAHAKSVGEKLAILERALNEGSPLDRLAEYQWLGNDAFCDDRALAGWAMRLADKLVDGMSPQEHAAWQAEYGVAAA